MCGEARLHACLLASVNDRSELTARHESTYPISLRDAVANSPRSPAPKNFLRRATQFCCNRMTPCFDAVMSNEELTIFHQDSFEGHRFDGEPAERCRQEEQGGERGPSSLGRNREACSSGCAGSSGSARRARSLDHQGARFDPIGELRQTRPARAARTTKVAVFSVHAEPTGGATRPQDTSSSETAWSTTAAERQTGGASESKRTRRSRPWNPSMPTAVVSCPTLPIGEQWLSPASVISVASGSASESTSGSHPLERPRADISDISDAKRNIAPDGPTGVGVRTAITRSDWYPRVNRTSPVSRDRKRTQGRLSEHPAMVLSDRTAASTALPSRAHLGGRDRGVG
jgi:hypothetical protein